MQPISSKRRGGVTQKDVAKRAGVSQAAVSAVFRGDTRKIGVSDNTRERILRAVKELNYRPNISARAMRSQRTFNLGFFTLAQGPLYHEPVEFRDGLYTAASERDYHIVLIRMSHSEAGGPDSLPSIFRQAHLDAMVIGNARFIPSEVAQAVNESNLPIVYLNEKAEHNAVYCDEVEATRQLMQQLFEKGLERIHFVRLHPNYTHHSAVEREGTYQACMREQGLEPHSHLLPYRDPGSGLLQAMRTNPAPDAILAYNEHTLVLTERAFMQAGISTESLQFATFDYGLFGQYIARPFLTSGVPRFEMGQAAARMAIDLATDDASAPAPSVIVQASLREVPGVQLP
ncbi:MAG: LacI family DNA-binding transcriptional regulator [Opitutales bacterium]